MSEITERDTTLIPVSKGKHKDVKVLAAEKGWKLWEASDKAFDLLFKKHGKKTS